MSSNSSSGVARITSEARRALQVLVWPSIHLALHLDLPCLRIQPRRAPSARLALCSSLHPPLPWHPPQTSYKRSSGPLFISPLPLPLHAPQTSYKCSSGLSLHLGLLLDLPCLRIQPRRATRAHLASPSILPFSWTSPAFAFSPDELQELVWALYSSLHCPCLRIQPRRATSARLGFVFFFFSLPRAREGG